MKCIDKRHYDQSNPDLWFLLLNFERFEHIPTKTDYNYVYSNSFMSVYEQYTNIVYNWFEEPNCLVAPGMHDSMLTNDNKLHKILSFCKYSVECYNKLHNTDKWTLVFMPFNEDHIPEPMEKIYDVFYSGHIGNSPISNAIPVMEKYNSCFVCYDYGTNRGVNYKNKLQLNSQSKITLTHGLLTWPSHYAWVADAYPTHTGLSHVKSHGLAPQFKQRTLDAAACRSLILNKHDMWNDIEDYFVPDEDFLYWYDTTDLTEKITYILEHYDEFLPMIESAHNKLKNNFSTKNYFNQILKNL